MKRPLGKSPNRYKLVSKRLYTRLLGRPNIESNKQSVGLEEIDTLLEYFDEGYAISHDEAYRRFSKFAVTHPANLPHDPYSSEYRGIYMDIYKNISGRDQYTSSNEGSIFDVSQMAKRPYPYFTQSTALAGTHYGQMARLLSIMELQPNARILDCGFGSGNTTVALAMLGFNVTAVDVESKYCSALKIRADAHDVKISIINDDYFWIENAGQKFDAIVFFESFHHCWEFERLLKSLHRVVAPGGKIYFAAEPIDDHFPVPWGVRLDGESLFVARRNGWMELGFRSSYFQELLARTGWKGNPVQPNFWVATIT